MLHKIKKRRGGFEDKNVICLLFEKFRLSGTQMKQSTFYILANLSERRFTLVGTLDGTPEVKEEITKFFILVRDCSVQELTLETSPTFDFTSEGVTRLVNLKESLIPNVEFDVQSKTFKVALRVTPELQVA